MNMPGFSKRPNIALAQLEGGGWPAKGSKSYAMTGSRWRDAAKKTTKTHTYSCQVEPRLWREAELPARSALGGHAEARRQRSTSEPRQRPSRCAVAVRHGPLMGNLSAPISHSAAQYGEKYGP